MEALLNAIAVGGDLGIWVLVGIAWHFDKRVTWCERELEKPGA